MRLMRPALLLLPTFLISIAVAAQQPPRRDPEAVAILTQCLNAAGGAQALTAVRDFSAPGTIIYFWAGKEVQGRAMIRGRGTNDFRVDANLPEGTRSWVGSFGHGSTRDPGGPVKAIPAHNTLNLGALSFPQLKVAAVVNNSSLSIQYVGLVDLNGRRTYVIHVKQALSPSVDPDGILTHLTAMDFLIDNTTYEILLVRDTIHPDDNATQDLVHEVEFSDYRLTNSCVVPFSITERVNGQRTWTIQLSAIRFNAGLTDSDFQL